MGWLADETGLDRCAANYVPLTPLSHLNRAADVYAGRTALVYGPIRRSWAEFRGRVARLASALAAEGIRPGDVVATLLPNVPAQVEATFGIPAAGAIICTINTRLDSGTVAYTLDHSGARMLICDAALIPLAQAALAEMQGPRPEVIAVADPVAALAAPAGVREYESLLAAGNPDAVFIMPQDEWESIALNYTSGTTGRPKGVVYHHRGAYLATTANAIGWRMVLFPVYLTIAPLFHCNGWCHTWMIPMMGGTIVCCRDITARNIFNAIADEGVTHFGAAPIVLNTLINSPVSERRTFAHVVELYTAGAPPPAATLAAIEPMGFNVTQVYGMTETYGPSVECTWMPHWDGRDGDERANLKARTGVPNAMMEATEVHDSRGNPVPRDSTHQGEVAFRGNLVMKGYYRNPEATAEAFRGGWMRSGDIAIQHPDGYIKVVDRAKDIIISGGENVSSVEVEGVLMRHPAVSLCAVVAKPDEKWGEVPCAFIELKSGAQATEAEIIAFVRERLAGFKTPKAVMFEELPKTSTGKIQKFELRKRAKALAGHA